MSLPDDFFRRPAPKVASELIGAVLTVDGVGGVIVETEAYDRDDPASHSYCGPTSRNGAMFGPPGRAYVYRAYGMHWCLNLVCGEAPGAAVLIRALEPAAGLDRMQARRGLDDVRRLCSGPGRLCQALAVNRVLDGAPLDQTPFALTGSGGRRVAAGPRIGISKAADRPWRFVDPQSRFISRAIPRGSP